MTTFLLSKNSERKLEYYEIKTEPTTTELFVA